MPINKPIKYKVQFTCIYDATVEVMPGEVLFDVIQNIDVPENDQCRYNAGSINVKFVEKVVNINN